MPYKAEPAEIARRKLDTLGRRNTEAGFGRDRTKTYLLGGADPGNVVSVPQTYNQYGVRNRAMPEGLAEFFIRCMSPTGHRHRSVCRRRDDGRDRASPSAVARRALSCTAISLLRPDAGTPDDIADDVPGSLHAVS